MHVVEHIVGRSGELRSVDVALEELAHGRGAALEIEGEPGIGKTRLLAEVCRLAEERGHLVLGGSASELENELPFWVFVDALDDCVRALPPAARKRLDADELARVLPPAGGPPRAISLPDERHRAHHAVRELLSLLAERQPVVLALDDLHWADSGSLELLGALLRRPPTGPVLIALALRPRQIPERLLPALERANRAGTLQRVELGALSLEEARSLLGDARRCGLRGVRRQPVLPPAARARARPHRAPPARRDRGAGGGARAALRAWAPDAAGRRGRG